ncbi:hypothetical protein V6N13_074917 [Hibiscus sabdariffa]|uniref:Uncharacterized protein n=1 Tax=Hibiscus sabdariffa TaxID=183260 RepID=A0ABR2UA01_9ROSI
MERKEMRRRVVELKVEMEEMIKQGQRDVGQKLEAMEQECEKLMKSCTKVHTLSFVWFSSSKFSRPDNTMTLPRLLNSLTCFAQLNPSYYLLLHM